MAQRFSPRALTTEVRKLAEEAFSVTDDGTPITRAESLARLLWNLALGYTEKVRDENGTLKDVTHPPVAWAGQFLYDRLEGRATTAVPEDDTRIRAADKVRELAKQRLNKMAASVIGPPVHRPKP
jgi:hypothetical protein